ncbi:FtsX-like permease family protein [Alkalibaculum sp. M08DMB]|uniref:FtsX-like permease family protein n=1 Tax=Alkalibaculum sporogenes TaxID=2655001 RepID=A0A6A7KCF3_9FIRM|nr:FtsX-like permease family protein [Alkalibaculum sporogenes]MPW26857.1 FtsX-like permease family protein [Alkalibaculum sporogenes]
MNILNKLTIRQLKLNKKRTLITIVGVIISVAMITSVATLAISFMDLMQRQVISDEGGWHVLYENVNSTQIEAIKNDEETKDVILSRDTGYAFLEGSQNDHKPYIFIREYNEEGFENFPIELKEGRFPKKENEIIISEAIITNAKVHHKIGDVLTFEIGQRYVNDEQDDKVVLSQVNPLRENGGEIQEVLTKEMRMTYTIVGITERPTWEHTWSPGYTVLSYIDENIMNSREKVNASIILNSIDSTLFEHAENLASQNNIEKVGFHDTLLRYYGVVSNDKVRSMLITLSVIIMVIIMVGSISLIYNAFAISVSERSRYLGMLSSVGATKKQKRNSVFFEGAIIGAISIPIGMIAGLVGISVTFRIINSMLKGALGVSESLRLVVLPATIFVAIMVSIITILISTYIPAKRASNISAIDAIRQTTDVKITGKEVTTSKLTRKIFGLEGELGLKNLKRNKSRYRATVLSLIISMILFLAVSYFTSSLEKSILLSQEGVNYDIEVFFNEEDRAKQEEIIQKITSLDNITEDAYINKIDMRAMVEEDFMADHLKGSHKDALEDGKYPYYVIFNAVSDEVLKAYAKEVGADSAKLLDPKKPSAIVIDTVRYEKSRKYVETKAVKLKLGEMLELEVYNNELEGYTPIESVEIAALTDKVPMGISSVSFGDSFHVIVSENVLNKIVQANKNISKIVNTTLFLRSNDPLRLQENIEEIQKSYGLDDISIFNFYMARQREEQMIVLISVFTYAFILLITTICIANIFNTISTGIALRKREFAMLKSVGMTPKSFNKMINYESIFYGMKALLYGLPISFGIMVFIHQTLMAKFDFEFTFPWISVFITIVAVFIIVGVAVLYSSKKIKKENIIDALKQESI